MSYVLIDDSINRKNSILRILKPQSAGNYLIKYVLAYQFADSIKVGRQKSDTCFTTKKRWHEARIATDQDKGLSPMRKSKIFITALTLTAISCGQSNDHEANTSSSYEEENYAFDPNNLDYSLPENDGSFDFRQAAKSLAGLSAKVKKETIRVCLTDSTNSAARRALLKDVILKWIEPMRALSTVALASNVELVAYNTTGCDVRTVFGNYNPARTQLGTTPTVYINNSGWFGSSTVTLHEFGHAFGLLDTYTGSGGACQTGQPASVMCYAKYDQLLDDDIKGIQSVYRTLFPSTSL